MLEVLIRIAFYLIAGLALLIAGMWYGVAVFREVTGRHEVVIAPFEVVGAADNRSLGVGLAHLLQARLLDIERDIGETNEGARAPAPAPASTAPSASSTASKSANTAMPQLVTRAADLRLNLLDPATVKLSVGGVDVGGVLPWMQSFLAAPRSLQLTLYQGKDVAQVFGTLRAFGLHDDGMRVTVRHGQDTLPIDKVIDAVAYEIARRRRAEGDNRRIRVLSGAEFQTLVDVMHEATVLNRRVADGRGALPEFQELQARLAPLVDQVPGWAELAYVAGSIAESAKDAAAANKYYGLAQQALLHDADPGHLRSRVDAKLAEVQLLVAQAKVDATESVDGASKQTIEGYVRTATDYLNVLFGHALPPPKVRFIGKKDPPGAVSFWDGQNVVVPPAVARSPDVAYREASWPHIMLGAGSEAAADFEAPSLAILHAYADILPMVIQQHERSEDANSSKWELVSAFESGPGYTYLSFAHLGSSSGGTSGNWYAAHMRDYDTTSPPSLRMYKNSGIIDRAFYEAARRMGTDKAAGIWIKALLAVKIAGKTDFQRFAALLSDAAAASDRPALRDALLQVGLDPSVTSVSARQAQR